MQNKISIIGYYPYPTSVGGISVQIKRIGLFLKEYNIPYIIYAIGDKTGKIDSNILVFNKKRWWKIFFRLPFDSSKVIHSHFIFIMPMHILMYFLKIFNKKIILSIHIEGLEIKLKKMPKILRILIIYFLKKYDCIIADGEHIKTQLLNIGINNSKIKVIFPYIRPILSDEERNIVPKQIYNLLEKSNFKIIANGQIDIFKNHRDAYGVDMLIELTKQLKKKKYDIVLLYALLFKDNQTKEEKKYYSELRQKIKEYNVEKYFYFYEVTNSEFWPLLEKADLFLRPTSTDTYGVSIAEALSFGIPSIASDVCPRPNGTILFKNRDLDDFVSKTIDVINNYEQYREKIKNLEIEDNFTKILKVYQDLCNYGKV